MFELEVPTPARLLDIIVLSQKNRQPDENPGAKLTFNATVTNDALAAFDGRLKSFLFTRTGAASPQAALEGVTPVSDTPNLSSIGAHLPSLKWAQELVGYTLELDLGLGGRKSALTIEACTLSNWRIGAKEGGTVEVKFDCESADVSGDAFGKLAKLKSREVKIMLAPPKLAEGEEQPELLEKPKKKTHGVMGNPLAGV